MVLELVDEAEILLDYKTDTTRWVLWQHSKTRQLSLAIAQKDQVVSINIENIIHFCARILPQFITQVEESRKNQQ